MERPRELWRRWSQSEVELELAATVEVEGEMEQSILISSGRRSCPATAQLEAAKIGKGCMLGEEKG